jgi:hypothetical protein
MSSITVVFQCTPGSALASPLIAMDPLQQILDKATMAGLLNPIGADPVKLRTNLYANDTALFLHPVASNVANLKQIMQVFGSATGLCTNIQKSEVLPI